MEHHRNRISSSGGSVSSIRSSNDDIIRLATKTAGIERDDEINRYNNDDTRWRRYGQSYRRELLQQDKLNGGTVFTVNPNCGIDKYHIISQRVSYKKVWCSLFVSFAKCSCFGGRGCFEEEDGIERQQKRWKNHLIYILKCLLFVTCSLSLQPITGIRTIS